MDDVEGKEKDKDKDKSSAADRSRKRKLMDAATGTAWGAKSFSAAKINSFKDSGNDPGFSDFGRYFAEKQRKLREQYLEDAGSSALRDTAAAAAAAAAQHIESDGGASSGGVSRNPSKLIFQGVAIFVDGFTIPTHQELRFIMMNNGGVFENYFSRQRVTHIICSTLPDNKIMNPRMLSRGLPIVKPEWIVESMKVHKLLPWENYQLERLAHAHPGQQTIAATFAALKDGSSATKEILSSYPGDFKQVDSNEGASSVDCALGQRTLSDGSGQHKTCELSGQVGANLQQNEDQQMHRSLSEDSNPATCRDLVPVLPIGTSTEDKSKDLKADRIAEDGTDSYQGKKGGIGDKVAEQKAASGEAVNRPFRSSLSDTDFVQNFFKYSRLHFIGTWRNRYLSLADSFRKNATAKNKDRDLMEANPDGKPMVIHLDMDCFFVAVVVRNRPELAGKAVAVCHSDSERGTAEISSANYPARAYGIRAGMYVKSAKALCPDLKIISYDFAGYEEVADKVYSILHNHCTKVQAVSCDEAFLDVSGHPDPIDLAARIRDEIYGSTLCSASAGIAENLLLARLATKKAKPNGQYSIKPDEVRQFMAVLPVDELPGVGWALREKLHSNRIYTCADLQSLSKGRLQKDYGSKTGSMLWSYAQGIDDREVQPAQERKSIGAEVNWGVRFETMDDAQKFLVTLSNEVAGRLESAGTCGRTITLKIKKRRDGVGEPEKYLGCGVCDSFSRSETVGYATNSADVLLRIGRQLYTSLHIDPVEVRGMGLQVSRLVSNSAGNRKHLQALDSWLEPPNTVPPVKDMRKLDNNNLHHQVINKADSDTVVNNRDSPERESPKLNQPSPSKPEQISIRFESSEVMEQDLNNKERSKEQDSEQRRSSSSAAFSPHSEERRIVQQVLEGTEHNVIKLRTPPKEQRIANALLQRKGKGKTAVKSVVSPLKAALDLPPISQLDKSVLEALPPELLAEINLAYDRRMEKPSRAEHSKAARKVSFGTVEQGEGSGSNKSVVDTKLFVPTHGSPDPDPKPVVDTQHAYFSASGQSVRKSDLIDHRLMHHLLEGMSPRNPAAKFSSHLLSSGCYVPIRGNADTSGLEILIQQCVKLLTRYVRDTASRDLEEVHLVVLYMRRLGGRCKLWRAVEEIATPAIKDIINGYYGGQLH